MDRLESIYGYDLRSVIETGVGAFYWYTLGIGPLLLGYCMGRWAPVYIRAIPLLFIVPAGLWWMLYSDHFFSIYVIGNLIYTILYLGNLV